MEKKISDKAPPLSAPRVVRRRSPPESGGRFLLLFRAQVRDRAESAIEALAAVSAARRELRAAPFKARRTPLSHIHLHSESPPRLLPSLLSIAFHFRTTLSARLGALRRGISQSSSQRDPSGPLRRCCSGSQRRSWKGRRCGVVPLACARDRDLLHPHPPHALRLWRVEQSKGPRRAMLMPSSAATRAGLQVDFFPRIIGRWRRWSQKWCTCRHRSAASSGQALGCSAYRRAPTTVSPTDDGLRPPLTA